MSGTVLRDAAAGQRLSRDGFACLDLIGPDRVDRLRAVFARFAARYDRDFLATLLIPDPGHRRAVHQVLAQELNPLAEAALLDYRAVFWGFAVKRPGADGEVSLHQDIAFTARDGRPGITLWAPLVDVAPANGCLSLVPGSHRTNDRPRGPGTPFPYPDAEALIRQRYLVEVPATAGTAILMDQRTFHCSPPNAGGAQRPAVTAVLLPREQPLRYYHRTVGDAGPCLEGFEVDDDFLLRHRIGLRPDGGHSLGTEPEAVAELHTDVMSSSALSGRQ